jgi:hypothetical protein
VVDDACGVAAVLGAVGSIDLVVDVVGIHLRKGYIFVDPCMGYLTWTANCDVSFDIIRRGN